MTKEDKINNWLKEKKDWFLENWPSEEKAKQWIKNHFEALNPAQIGNVMKAYFVIKPWEKFGAGKTKKFESKKDEQSAPGYHDFTAEALIDTTDKNP